MREKYYCLKLTLPESWTAAGVALDLSAAANGGFTYISKCKFVGVAATDMQVNYDLISSAVGTGDAAHALLASGCKVVGHQGAAKTGNSQAATIFGSCEAAENHSTKTCYMHVWGW
jgi:hypothetical protein